MLDDKTYIREPAKRIFAAEFRTVRLVKKDEKEEKAPVFAVTPTGAVANRFLICGVLTEKDAKEDSKKQRMYRIRVNDNTGTVVTYITSLQSDAMRQIASISAPAFVALIGKPNIYTTDRGTFTSLRVEEIVKIDAETRKIWILDTAKQTLDRINAMRDGTCPVADEVNEFYEHPKMDVFEEAVKRAVGSLASQ